MSKESRWEDCMENFSSISISPDKAKAKSLIDTALGRNQFLAGNEIIKSNANYIFEGYYSSALELLHAILLLHGYKVGNHICLGYYLRDILKNDKLYRRFDDCRFKRNSLIHYGKKMDFEIAKDAIEKCNHLMQELTTILNKEMKKN